MPELTTNEQASPPTRRALALARPSERLTEPWIEAAVEASHPARPGWSHRLDGWTPDRMRTFLSVLAECGVVADAARAVGMSRQKAYAFRNSARGRAFAFAWRTALLRGRDRLADEVMSRALDGCVDVIVRDGKVWGERHRFDNRLTMAVLTRLDHLATPKFQRDEMPALIAPEFEELVDKVCEGGKETAEFLRSRCPTPYTLIDEAKHLHRAEQYVETGSGLTEEELGANAQAEEDDDDLGDWDDLLFEDEEDEEGEDLSSDSSSVALAKEEGFEVTDSLPEEQSKPLVIASAEEEKDDEWHMSLLSPSSGVSSSSPSSRGEGDRPAEPDGGGAGEEHCEDPAEQDPPRNGEGDQPAQPVGGGVEAKVQPPRSHNEHSEPQPEWILGDDGIAIKTINGRLPPHLRHGSRIRRG